MTENKIKRNKLYKKILLSYDYKEPFQVLVDYFFAKESTKINIGIQKIKDLLRSECKLFIPKCEYEKFKKFKKINDITGECEIIKCRDEADHTKCLLNIIREDNRHHFLLATSDSYIRKRITEIKNLPLIKIKRLALYIDFGDMKRRNKTNIGEPANKKEVKKLKKIFGEVNKS